MAFYKKIEFSGYLISKIIWFLSILIILIMNLIKNYKLVKRTNLINCSYFSKNSKDDGEPNDNYQGVYLNPARVK
jgi:hypothetical protein